MLREIWVLFLTIFIICWLIFLVFLFVKAYYCISSVQSLNGVWLRYICVYSCFLFFLTQVLYTLLCNFSTQQQVLERLIAVHKVFLPSLSSLLFNYCIALHYMDYINQSLFNQLPINRHLAVSINFIQVCFVFLELYLQDRFSKVKFLV